MKIVKEFYTENGREGIYILTGKNYLELKIYSENGLIWLSDDTIRELYQNLKERIEQPERNEILFRQFDLIPDLEEDDIPFSD